MATIKLAKGHLNRACFHRGSRGRLDLRRSCAQLDSPLQRIPATWPNLPTDASSFRSVRWIHTVKTPFNDQRTTGGVLPGARLGAAGDPGGRFVGNPKITDISGTCAAVEFLYASQQMPVSGRVGGWLVVGWGEV